MKPLFGAVLAALLQPSFAAAAADGPTKPVRLIVAFAAGGPSDAAGRAYAEVLSAAFGLFKERERWTPIIKKIMSEKPQ